MRYFYIALSIICLASSSAAGRAETIDPSFYYRLTTQWQGDGKALDAHYDGRDQNRPLLSQTRTDFDQLWKITPAGDGFWRLSSLELGEGMALGLDQAGQPILEQATNSPDQMWKVVPLNGGFARLVNRAAGDARSLDIANDGTNNRPVMADSGNYSGQYWKLAKVFEAPEGGSGGGTASSAPSSTPSTTPARAAATDQAIDQYIRSLSYDPRRLLAVREDGATEALPAGESMERSVTDNGVIVCKKNKQGLSEDLEEVSILSPTRGVIFPGALVRANRQLAEGLPEAISLGRAPVKISVDLPGLGANGQRVIADPKNGSIQPAISDILETWNTKPASQGYINAARSSFTVKRVYSMQQASLELGFSAKWLKNDLNSSLKVSDDREKAVTVGMLKQVFYTVTIDLPEKPSSVFAERVSLQDVRNVVDANNPPAYVKSVDYGRIIMVRMETDRSQTKADLDASLKYFTSGGVETNSKVKGDLNLVAKNSTFTVYTLGGNAEVSTQVISANNADDLITALKLAIQKNARYARDNPGVPIAYSVSFLKDHRNATMAFSTDFVKTDCTEFADGYVKVKHSGAYVAKFQVTWMEKNAQGIPIPKIWVSGNKTVGFDHTVSLPGDATNVRVQGWAATGLVWDPWGEIINKALNGPSNECYRAKGTTLNRSWDNNC